MNLRHPLDDPESFSDINAEYVLDEGGFGTQSILHPQLVLASSGRETDGLVRVRARGTAVTGRSPIPDTPMSRYPSLEKAMVAARCQAAAVIAKWPETWLAAPANKYTAAFRPHNFVDDLDLRRRVHG